ncbi:hypothetical protein SASPL_113851 [Salvia splendens]|uniref:Uncharacterized protein n=1 Tax=Salvia splendens TaxID=180675 RepID=A0A8X8Y4F6_SALSN|nr:hypothetical protein SASPL_113851 [Salvia splendens]
MAKTHVLIMATLLFVGTILPSSQAQGSGQKTIDYGTLQGDNYYGHPGHNPANSYELGCTAAEHCHGRRRLMTDEEEDAVEAAEQGAANIKDTVVNLFD